MIKTVGLILLALLKILGWVLLFFLLFAVVSLLLVLFVPVRYHMAVQNGEAYVPVTPAGSTGSEGPLQNFRAHVRVTWLLHFIHVSFVYDTNAEGMENHIRFAGIDVLKALAWFRSHKAAGQSRKAEKGRRKSFQAKKKADSPELDKDPAFDGTFTGAIPDDPTATDEIPDDPTFSDYGPDSGKSGPSEKTSQAKEPEKKKKAKGHTNADKSNGPGIRSKFASLKDKIYKFHQEFTDETNRSSVSHLWKELCFLLRNYKPKKLKADITFSLANPAITGEVLGMVSLLPFIYQYPCQIMPDFISEKLYVEGKLMAEGKITVVLFLASLLRLIRDKNIRQCIRKLQGN